MMKILGLKSFPGRVRTWDRELCYQDRFAEWWLTEAGSRAFVATTRKEVPKWLLQKLNVQEITTRVVPVETSTISAITRAFKWAAPKTQVSVGRYRIDCVLEGETPIAVECDERGHSDRSPDYEADRELYLKSRGYRIFRYNPDASDFNIFDTIGELGKLLVKS